MAKARRYGVIVAGFAIGAFLAPYLVALMFVAAAAAVETFHL